MTRTRTILFVTADGQFNLSVNPKQVTVSQDNKDKTLDLLNIGEVSVLGNRSLIKMSVSTFLPADNSPFFTGTSPDTIIALMKKSKNGKKPIRIIISGTDVNLQFSIASMSETYTEGDKDVTVAWSFTEYRENASSVAALSGRYTNTGLCARNTSNAIPKTVIVMSGDTLWGIAKRYYDDGSYGDRIASVNDLDRNAALTVGMRLVMPV